MPSLGFLLIEALGDPSQLVLGGPRQTQHPTSHSEPQALAHPVAHWWEVSPRKPGPGHKPGHKVLSSHQGARVSHLPARLQWVAVTGWDAANKPPALATLGSLGISVITM